MANDYNSNPILLDTFTSAIDVGSTLFNNTNARIYVKHIEWQTPTSTSHTCLVKDGAGKTLMSETCTVANQSIFKPFNHWVQGITIAISGVGSGKISILVG